MHRKSKLQQYQGIDEYSKSEDDSDSSGGEDLYNKKPAPRRPINNYEQDAKYGSVAPTARLKNPNMFQRVSNALEHIRRRRLTMGEQASLRNYINGLPAARLAQYDDIEIEKNIVNNWIKGQNAMNNEDEIIDTHELLKKNIGLNSENDTITASINKTSIVPVISNAVDVSSVLGNSDIYSIQRVINPKALEAKTQILLDSRWRSLDTDGTTLFKWSFSNNMITQQGTFNTISPVRDIIAIKVFPFKIPYTVNAENPTKNITIYYNEFSNQCVPAQESRKYHHWMDYITEDDWISLNAEKYNKGRYHFDKPITSLDTLTVNFGAPLQIIQFDLDRMNATFTTGNPTTLTFPSAHNLDTGYTVYFTNFSTSNANADSAIINTINSAGGRQVIRINATQVSIAVDTSGLVGVPNVPIAFFGEKRFYIPLEITYIRPKT